MNILKNYHLEVRTAPDREYLKVFLKDMDLIQTVQSLIQQLPSVGKVNVTSSNSRYSPPKNLTIYPKVVYNAKEMLSEVEAALECYFSGGTFDPVFKDEPIPALGDAAYFKILDYIIRIGTNLEKYPRATKHLGEEGMRDYFLAFLNVVSSRHSAAGEAFNKKGRTDILVQDMAGNNIFIAECKLWNGSAKIKDAINQLLEKYVNWRDEKVAIIVFNKDISAFSEIINKAKQAVVEHTNCVRFIEARMQTSFSYIFKHSDDPNKRVKLELVLFNYQ